MVERSIFSKTDAGRAEIGHRTAGLTPVERRLLILVDGKKTKSDLDSFVRVAELEPALARLLQFGLIESRGSSGHAEQDPNLLEPVAEGFSASRLGESARAATDIVEFLMVRQQAQDFVAEQLGDAGQPICAAIDRCNSPADLRKLLRGIEIFVGQRLSAEVAQSFARHFGSLLL